MIESGGEKNGRGDMSCHAWRWCREEMDYSLPCMALVQGEMDYSLPCLALVQGEMDYYLPLVRLLIR